MSDPLNPETYGPPIGIDPGAVLHCTRATRVAWRGPWELRDGGAAWADGARLVFRGFPVYLDGPPADPLFGLLARQSEPRQLAAVQEHAPSTLAPRPIR